MAGFPIVRLRRYRKNDNIRKLFDTPLPSIDKFIWPVFAVPGLGIADPIETMPGQCRYSPDELCRALYPLVKLGLGGVLVFGIPANGEKDEYGTSAASIKGIVPETIKILKKEFPSLTVSADVCLCAYTSHGHCGPLDNSGNVDNDKALRLLSDTAVCYAEAGADIVAPSAMMDGQIGAIRSALDRSSLTDTMVMSYSTKFASGMYGPFRDAEQSSPSKGDRKSYQTSYNNLNLALRESELDIDEGADLLMVKPALFYLDILAKIRATTLLPIAAYNVSGEYTMLSLMAREGTGDLKTMVRESVSSIFRAGADIIISYWANQYDSLFRD